MKKGLFIIVLGCIALLVSTAAYAEHDYAGNLNFLYGSNANISSATSDYEWSAPYDLTEMGVNFDFGKKSWPFRISLGYYTSCFDGTSEKEGVVEDSADSGPGEMPGGGTPPAMVVPVTFNQQTAPEAETAETTMVPADIESTFTEIRLGVKKIWNPSESLYSFVDFGVSTFLVNIDYQISENDYNVEPVSGNIEPDAAIGVYINSGLYYTLFDFLNLGAEIGYSRAEIDEDYYRANVGGLHVGMFLGYHFELF